MDLLLLPGSRTLEVLAKAVAIQAVVPREVNKAEVQEVAKEVAQVVPSLGVQEQVKEAALAVV